MICWKIRTISIVTRSEKQGIFNWMLRYNCELCDRALNWWNQTCSYWETSVRLSTWINIHGTFSYFWDYRDSDARTKSDSSAWQWFDASSKLSIENLIGELILVVMEKLSKWKPSFFRTKGNFSRITVPSKFWNSREKQRVSSRISLDK